MERKLIFGATGSIATMNSPHIVRDFIKRGFDVKCILTQNATRFVTKELLEDLTRNECYLDFRQKSGTFHIELARFADRALIAPASANFIASLALGLANNILLTELLAFTGKIFIAPAMNTSMYNHPTQQNYRKILKERGVCIIEPQLGEMVCGEVGIGKMAEVDEIVSIVCADESPVSDSSLKKNIFFKKKCLVSLGATRAYIDPVRFISNESSGKMGLSIISALKKLGADLEIIACNVDIGRGPNVHQVKSNEDYDRCLDTLFPNSDFFFSLAAVSDFSSTRELSKRKKSELKEMPPVGIDYLSKYGEHKSENQKIIAFSADTENFLDRGLQKLKSKNCDAIFINPVFSGNDNVFGSDYNQGHLVVSNSSNDVEQIELKKASKNELANRICAKLDQLWR